MKFVSILAFNAFLILATPLFSQSKFVENAIKSNTKNGDYYLVSVPEKKSYSIDDIDKFCKENNYDCRNIQTRNIALYGIKQTVVTSFEVIDKIKNAELSAARANQLQETQQREILNSIENADIKSFLYKIDSYCQSSGGDARQDYARKFYSYFRNLPATPYVVNRMKARTIQVSGPGFWSGRVMKELDEITAIKNNLLISIVEKYIRNKEKSYLDRMKSEGFYFTDLSISTLEDAEKFCGNCEYISAAIAEKKKQEKEASEQAQREAAAYERRRASSSSSSGSSSSTTSDYSIISGDENIKKVETSSESVASIDIYDCWGGGCLCNENYSVKIFDSRNELLEKFDDYNSDSYIIYSSNSDSFPLKIDISYYTDSDCRNGNYRAVSIKIYDKSKTYKIWLKS